MRVKQTPNGDYVVDIDECVLNKLGLTAGDAVYWDKNGMLKPGNPIERMTTPDTVFSIEIDRVKGTQRMIVCAPDYDVVSIDLPSPDHVRNLAAILNTAEKVINDGE